MLAASVPAGGGSRPIGFALLTTVVIFLAGCGQGQASGGPPTSSASTSTSAATGAASTPRTAISPSDQPVVPAQLIASDLDLRSGPVAVPLVLRLPSLQLSVPVLGVGITPANVMDAPFGPADDPVWQRAFWFRGGGIPGAVGTATLAGHVDDALGRPAAFTRLKDLRVGDTIIVHDTRSGIDVTFMITETETYSSKQTSDPAVLARLYGAGPVAGTGPQPAPDGLSHLVLITCAGDYVHGGFDHRLAVFAQRIP